MKNLFRYVVAGLSLFVATNNATASMDVSDRERDCLEMNIAQESSGEPLAGQRAVADTTLFRAWLKGKNGRHANVCDIVYAKNQFSWVGHPRVVTKEARYNAKIVAQKALEHFNPNTWPVTHFHAKEVSPKWASKFKFVKRIGDHLFYASPRGLKAVGQYKASKKSVVKVLVASAKKRRVIQTIQPVAKKSTPEPLTYQMVANIVATKGIGGFLVELFEPRG